MKDAIAMIRPTRRSLLAGAAASLVLPAAAHAALSPRPGPWRSFVTETRIDLPGGTAPIHVWVPVPAVTEKGWAEAGAAEWSGNADRIVQGATPDGAAFVHAVWEGGHGAPTLSVTAEAAARDRAVDLLGPGTAAPMSAAERARWTAPTDLIPTDGIVRDTAESIVAGVEGDLPRARAIFDWVVDNSARDPETRGCGLGDVASMLEMGDLSGKCADLNALFVGLARAAGLPARDVYGLRVAASDHGYASLGAKSADVTKAQHCRAEIFVEDHGWLPADPADVRKVMLEEPPGNLPATHPMVLSARAALLGAWEGNWIAYNFAHDVALPGARDGVLPFLMYPEAEIGGVRLDALDPASFAYTITAREVTG